MHVVFYFAMLTLCGVNGDRDLMLIDDLPEKISAEIPFMLPLPAPISYTMPAPLYAEELPPPKQQRCQGESVTLTSTTGTISWRPPWTEEEQNSLKNVDTCYWFIRLPSNFRIKISFDYFNVVDSPGCQGDHLVVYDTAVKDGKANTTLIATLCGDVKPEDIESQGSEVMIAFRSFSHLSQNSNGQRGFKISYVAISKDGGNIDQKQGGAEIFDEGEEFYEDEQYEDDPEPINQLVPRNGNQEDYLAALPTTRPSPVLIKPKIRPIDDNKLKPSVQTQKSQKPESKPVRTNEPEKQRPFPKKAQTPVEYDMADFQPFNSRVYEANNAPQLRPIASTKPTRLLRPTTLKPQRSTSPIKRLQPVASKRTQQQLKPKSPFLSDHQALASSAGLQAANMKCSGRIRLLTADSGQLSSPNFGYGNYYPDDLCFWQILAPENKRIRLGFSFLMLQPETGCYADYLNVYDGASETGSLIAAFCGAKSPPPDREILTSGNTAFIKFATDSSGEFPGFQMGYEFFDASVSSSLNSYSEKQPELPPSLPVPNHGHPPLTGETYCGGRRQLLFAPEGVIESPGYQPDNNMVQQKAPDECYWLISAPAEGRIKVVFKSLNLRHNGGSMCPDDSVTLYEGTADAEHSPKTGGIDLGQELAKFCGPNLPAGIETETNELLIGYTTRGGRVAANHGFRIEYEQIQSPEPVCMGRALSLKSSPGYISTPNYGRGNYAPNDQCSWLLTAAPNQRIKLVFEKFALEDSANCVKDSLILFDVGQNPESDYDGDDASSASQARPPLRDLCGHDMPGIVYSETNAVEIKFISDSSGDDKGIKIYYEFYDVRPADGVTLTTRRTEPWRLRTTLTLPQSPHRHVFTTPRRKNFQEPNTQATRKPTRRTRPTTTATTTTPTYDDYVEETAAPQLVEKESMKKHEEPLVPVPKLVQGPEGFVAILAKDPVDKNEAQDISQVVGRCSNKSTLLTAESGIIESPGFRRGFYPDADDCQWLIIADAKRRIQLYFETFDIELEPLCSHDTLTVYDGPSADSSQEALGVYCGQGQPEAVESTGPYMLIKFHSDAAGSGKGFKLYYNLTGTPSKEGFPDHLYHKMASKTLSTSTTTTTQAPTSPPLDNAAMSFIQALLRGVVGKGQQERLSEKATRKPATSLKKPPSRYQPIMPPEDFEIEDQETELFPLGGEFDVDQHKPFPRSENFETDLMPLVADTMAPYTWPPPTTVPRTTWPTTTGRPLFSAITDRCRGKVGVIVLNAALGKKGSLASPNFGYSAYANDDVCRWEIRSPTPRTRIRLRFVKFHLESGSPMCQNDFVEIFDGPGANFPMIGRFCGEQLPPNVVSTGNQLALRFVSDGMLSYAGFYAEFGAEPSEETTMANTLPPSPPRTEPPPTMPSTTTTTTTEPTTTTTTTSTTTTVLLTLPPATRSPFFYHPLVSQPPTTPVLHETSERCDGRLHQLVATAMPQFFTSPNFGPGRTYPSRDVCYWIVTSPSRTSNRVRLTFRYFDMEPPSPRCSPGDSLSIFDGPAETAPLLAVHCGSILPAEIISQTSASLFIKFESNSQQQYPGFVAAFDDYTAVMAQQQAFNETLRKPVQHTIPPPPPSRNQPKIDYYDENDEIGEPKIEPQIIPLTPPDNNLDLPPPLPDDYDMGNRFRVTTTKSPRASARERANRKNSRNEKPSLSSKWQCRAKDGSPAKLHADHSPRYLNSHQDFSSEDSFYSPNMDCAWLITANNTFQTKLGKVNQRVRLSFDEFRVERGLSDSTCLSDYVVIFDGPNEDSETVRKLCGSEGRDFSFISNTPSLLLKFHTDRTVEDAGFRLRYEAVTVNSANKYIDNLRPCGGRFMRLPPATTEQVQMFSSPNYGAGRKYFSNDSCKWLIAADEHVSKIRLNFKTFFVENRTPNCANDHVIVYDGPDENSPIIGKFCGLQTPPELTSSGRKMLIRFFSDNSIEYAGFSAEYTSFHEHFREEKRFPDVAAVLFEEDEITPKMSTSTVSTTSSTTTTTTSSPTTRKKFIDDDDEDYYRWSSAGKIGRSSSGAVARSSSRFGSTGPVMADDSPVIHNNLGQSNRLALRCNGQVFPVELAVPSENEWENETSIILVSPNYYGQLYVNNDECMWTVATTLPQSRIRIRFDDFDVQYSDGCYKDRLIIYDGGISGPRVYGPFCGRMELPEIVTLSNSVLIKFNTDESVERRGFRITLTATHVKVSTSTSSTSPEPTTSTTTSTTTTTTSTTHKTTTTTLKSSTILSTLPSSFVDGFWFRNQKTEGSEDEPHLIWSRPGMELTHRRPPSLTMTSFDTLAYYSQTPKVRSVLRSHMNRKQLLALTTSTTTAATTVPTTPETINIERLHEPCRERVFEFSSTAPVKNQIFASPADEANGRYFANDVCYWRISAPIGERIRLEFFEPFDLEASVTCLYDKLRIYDGADESSPLGGIFCGMTPPEPYVSTENVVYLKFQSDSTQNRAGFVVKFSYIE